MLKFIFSVRKKLKERGFTLVELLAVIVILAIIMLIAIPAVLNTVQSARKKSFVTYVDRVGTVATEKWLKDTLDGKSSENGCFVYNLKTDFDISNVGTFKGYVLVNSKNEKPIYYITLWNEDYMLIAYNYTEGINYKGVNKSIEQSLEVYDLARSDELKPSVLCNYGCSECVYESAESDPYNSDSTSNMTGDPMKIKGITILLKGSDFNSKAFQLSGETGCSSSNCEKIKYIKKSDNLNQELNPVVISNNDEVSQNNPVYMWFDTDTLYYYTEATKIYLNSDSSYLFSYMKGLIDANEFLSKLDSSNVTDMSSMFILCKNLTTIDLSNFNTLKVTNMANMFNSVEKLKYLDLSKFDTSNVTNMDGMFRLMAGIISLDLSNFDTSKVTNMANMFNGTSSLTSLNVSNFNTSKVSTMWGMFWGASSLTSLDVSHFDTSNVGYMYATFYNMSNLTSLDVSHFDTSNVVNMSGMFLGTSNLTSLDVSNFNTSNVENMQAMFYNMSSLTSLDVSHFDTSNVENMYAMFYNMSSLTSLDVSHFDTSNVVNMQSMFYKMSSLTSLDLSNFNTSNVENMQSMFYKMNKLTTIYVGNKWSTVKVKNSGTIFSYDVNLIGGSGTKYSSSHQSDIEYARVDDPTNSRPGYFTLKTN